MSRKSKIPEHHRQALESLGRNRLRELTAHLDVEGDRRVLANHVDALLHKVGFAETLEQLKRDELKAMCEALGLDASGREKAVLIARLVGESAAPAATVPVEATPEPPPPTARASRRAKEPAAPLGFEAKLWQAADALRNNMDAAEYKHVVLGLIFPKAELELGAPRGPARPAQDAARGGEPAAAAGPRRHRRLPGRDHRRDRRHGPT